MLASYATMHRFGERKEVTIPALIVHVRSIVSLIVQTIKATAYLVRRIS